MSAPSDPRSSTALAVLRLQASRARLAAALRPESAGSKTSLIDLMSGAFGAWARQQPWFAALRLLGGEIAAQAQPLLQRHPLLGVMLAALAGAAITALRPWRLLGAPLVAWLWTQGSSPPVLGALAAAMAAMSAGQQDPGPVAAGAAAASSGDGVSESSDKGAAPAPMGSAPTGT